MSHRIVWPVVAALSLGGLILVISQSSAQRRPEGGPMPGGPPGMPGRFVVANASSSQVLVLDTATGQVYRVKEDDFKKASDLPRPGDDARPPARDRRPEPRDKDAERPRDGRRPPAKDDGDKDKDKDRREER